MKHLLAVLTVVGVLSAVGIAEAGHPRAFHRHRHHHHHCPPPIAYRVPVYKPRVVYVEPQVIYPRFYGPNNGVSFYGRNFGLQFGW